MAPEREPGDERDRGQHERRRTGSVVNARPTSQAIAMPSLMTGLVRPSRLSELRRRPASQATIIRPPGASVRRRSRPRRRSRRRPARRHRATKRSSWVAAIRHAPRRASAARGSRAALVAVPVLAEGGLVEDEDRPGRRMRAQASERRRARRRTADTGCGRRTSRAAGRRRSISVRRVVRLRRPSPSEDLVGDALRQELAAPAPGRRSRPSRQARRGEPSRVVGRRGAPCRSLGRSRPTSRRPRVDLPLPFGPDKGDPLAGRGRRSTSRSDRLAAVVADSRRAGERDPTAGLAGRSTRGIGRHRRGVAACPGQPPGSQIPGRRHPRARPRAGPPPARPTSIGGACPVEGEHQVGQRPCGSTRCSIRTIVVAPRARRCAPAARGRRRHRPDRGWPSARRGRGPRARGARTPASASRCCCPPESRRDAATLEARRARPRPAPRAPARASASGGQPRFSSPNATSSSTRSMTSCVAGSWKTRPTGGGQLGRLERRASAPPTFSDPATRRRDRRAGPGRRAPGRACSCPSPTDRRRAGTSPGARRRRRPGAPADRRRDTVTVQVAGPDARPRRPVPSTGVARCVRRETRRARRLAGAPDARAIEPPASRTMAGRRPWRSRPPDELDVGRVTGVPDDPVVDPGRQRRSRAPARARTGKRHER